MNRPKISVCIATYNGEKFLREQLDSILKQLEITDEIVVSDDSSTDRTAEILLDYSQKDPRFRLILNQSFRDPIKNFENALKNANGEWIYLSDQDDVWLDGKVSTINKLLDEFDLVLHNSILTDEELNIRHPSFFEFFGSKKGLIKNMIKSSYYGSCMAFRRWVLVKALPFPNTKEIGHDLWLGLVAEMRGNIKLLDTPYLLYRRHNNTFTSRGLGGTKRNLFQMIRGRLVMIKEIVRFWLRGG
jgi:glycosyltransferase involved in cell wall biosynthesis